jgi:hypothetical protein
MNLFGLLVGIDEYHPDSKVGPLGCCVNDIRNFHAWLEGQAPAGQRQVKILLNEEATRDGFITAFREHLIDAPVADGDLVLFYYCGHGSYGPTAPKFAALGQDARDQDETLVLFDSRLPGKQDLADKELALLLASINQRADIVVVLDSCHSGSATRAKRPETVVSGVGAAGQRLTPRLTPRFTPASDKESRGLEDYVSTEAYNYSDMEPFGIPGARYVLLAACRRDEVAFEANAAGLFSGSLLRMLADGVVTPTYANLGQYLFQQVNRISAAQHPIIKVYGDFDFDRVFLSGSREAKAPGLLAYHDQDLDRTIVNRGALHGVPPGPEVFRDINVMIYDERGKLVGPARIESVLLEKSILDWDGDRGKSYKARMLYNALALTVVVRGNKEWVDAVFARVKDRDILAFIRDEKEGRPDFQLGPEAVGSEAVGLVIRDMTGGLVHGVDDVGEDGMDHMLKVLKQMAIWTYLSQLGHEDGGLAVDKIGLALKTKVADGPWVRHAGRDVQLEILPGEQIEYCFQADNSTATPLYAALYNLSSDYKIEKITTDVDATIAIGGKIATGGKALPMIRRRWFLLDPAVNAKEDMDIFVLLVSDREFADYFLEHGKGILREVVSLDDPRLGGGSRGKRSAAQEGMWAALRLNVRLKLAAS